MRRRFRRAFHDGLDDAGLHHAACRHVDDDVFDDGHDLYDDLHYSAADHHVHDRATTDHDHDHDSPELAEQPPPGG